MKKIEVINVLKIADVLGVKPDVFLSPPNDE